jgi:hypothetical protein
MSTSFPVLRTEHKQIETNLERSIEAELAWAGIPFTTLSLPVARGRIASGVVGELHNWGFTRNWYYWMAEGPGIPVEDAIELHEKFGREVRVEGHCGCPHPLEYRGGFGVGSYHVDSYEGLKALADTINKVAARGKEMQEKLGIK